jgi:hypothetical protein
MRSSSGWRAKKKGCS